MNSRPIVVRGGPGHWAQAIHIGPHALLADEAAGIGDDLGPGAHELLLAALGACTATTVRMYAERKGWALDDVIVSLTRSKDGETTTIARTIEIHGAIDAEQHARLLEIAARCPVHRTLSGEIRLPVEAAASHSSPA
jgi:putative redox protein